MSHAFSFLCDTYETEVLKTLSVWSQFQERDLAFRPEARARSPLEHFVHQCQSEEAWMGNMLGVTAGLEPLPKAETRLAFLEHYAAAAAARLGLLRAKEAAWWSEEASFFDVRRSRAWIFVRRVAHSAHHRGQLTVVLRLLGRALYSTYGPTADTGGLAANGADVVYRYADREELLAAERSGGRSPALSGPGARPAGERPGSSSPPAIECIQPSAMPTPGGHYSHGVVANGLLFIAGQLPIRGTERLTGADFATQTRQVLANLDAILAARGLTRSRLVQVRVYLTDLADWGSFNALYAEWIGDHRPARAVVPVPNLHFGLELEVEAVALACLV